MNIAPFYMTNGISSVNPVYYLIRDHMDVFEPYVSVPVGRNGLLLGLNVNVTFNSLTGPGVLVVRLNAAPTALSITVLPGVTGALSISASIPVVVGDLISLMVDPTGVPAGDADINGSIEYRAA